MITLYIEIINDFFVKNFIWFLGTCLTLFGILANHRLALYRNKQANFLKESTEFEKIIKKEFSDVYPIISDWPEDIDKYLRCKFPILQAAVSSFREVLPKRKKRDFDQAWFLYRLGVDGREIDKQCYHQYMNFTSPDHPIRNPKELFHENINRLLSFTK